MNKTKNILLLAALTLVAVVTLFVAYQVREEPPPKNEVSAQINFPWSDDAINESIRKIETAPAPLDHGPLGLTLIAVMIFFYAVLLIMYGRRYEPPERVS